jgi:hypothetical protein
LLIHYHNGVGAQHEITWSVFGHGTGLFRRQPAGVLDRRLVFAA